MNPGTLASMASRAATRGEKKNWYEPMPMLNDQRLIRLYIDGKLEANDETIRRLRAAIKVPQEWR